MDGQGTDDRRMHEGDKPGLDGDRAQERHEEPVAEGDRIGSEDQGDRDDRREAESDIAEPPLDEAHERAE